MIDLVAEQYVIIDRSGWSLRSRKLCSRGKKSDFFKSLSDQGNLWSSATLPFQQCHRGECHRISKDLAHAISRHSNLPRFVNAIQISGNTIACSLGWFPRFGMKEGRRPSSETLCSIVIKEFLYQSKKKEGDSLPWSISGSGIFIANYSVTACLYLYTWCGTDIYSAHIFLLQELKPIILVL